MARVKYDVRGVEGARTILPAGVYNVKLTSADVTHPDGKDERIEAVFEVINDKQNNGAKLYEYINLESEQARWKLREFLEALEVVSNGKGEAGTLDTSKLVGKVIGVKTFVRPADDARGFDEQARVRRMFAAEGATEEDVEEEDLDDEETTGEYDDMTPTQLKAELKERGLSTKGKTPVLISRLMEDDEQEEEEDKDDTEADLTWEDIDGMSRAELRQLNKDEELGVKIVKSKDDDTVKAEVAGALDIDVPEAEDEEEEGEEASEDDYDEWTDDELKEELGQRSLSVKGSTSVLVRRLRKDDADEEKPF